MGKFLLKIALLLSGIVYSQNFYVSSTTGSDSNDGSEGAPFKTIEKANEVLQDGGTCYLMQGVYRETVIAPVDNVTYKNYQDDYVVVTGLDVVENWTQHSGAIYKATALDSVTMVFVNGKHMDWARYPNFQGDRLSKGDMMEVDLPNADPVDYGKVIMNNEPSFPDNHWKGGLFHGVAGEDIWWTGLRGQIVSSTGNQLQCEDISFNWTRPQSGFGDLGRGFIIGAFNAMDTGKEWVWKDGELFYYTEPNQDINDVIIEARVRLTAFDLSDKSNVKLEGLHIKAGNILMPSANNCSIIGCTVKYPGSFANYYIDGQSQRAAFGDHQYSGAGISVGGNNNLIKDTYVGFTWLTGISLWGNFNTVDNCIIEECDWMGERYSLIQSLGDDNTITNNALSRAGRDGIDLGHNEFGLKYSRRATVKNNTIYDIAYLSPDSGYIYVHHRQGNFELANSELAYNILDGYHSSIYFSGHGGIYLDGGSSGYTIHHNVILNCETGVNSNNLRISHAPNHNFVFNNTFVNVPKPLRLNSGPRAEGNEADTQVVGINNVSTPTFFTLKYTGTELSNNVKILDSELVDIENSQFHLVAGSKAIDAGKIIEDPVWPEGIQGVTGITDGFVGAAPDAGAFEFGVEPWKAGGTLEKPVLIDELGGLADLINGTSVDQDAVDKVIAMEEAEKQRAFDTRWQTTNEDYWLLSPYSAYNTPKSGSLGASGGMAFRQFFDLVPNKAYRVTFTYDFANKGNGKGAGVMISAHEGELTKSNYSDLGSKNFSTNVPNPGKEKGTATFTFTPTKTSVYIVFHKIGKSSTTSRIEVSRLQLEIDELTEEEKAKATKWQTNDTTKWVLGETFADNPAGSATLEPGGARAWRQLFDLVPNESYKLSFNYEISNQGGGNSAGVRVSIHQGAFTDANYSNVATKDIITQAVVESPEIGTGFIEFTPTEDNVYAIFHKVGGKGGSRANAKVSNLSVDTVLSSDIYQLISGLSITIQNKSIVVTGATLENVYNSSGQEVQNNNLNAGIYFVRVAKDAIAGIEKVLVR